MKKCKQILESDGSEYNLKEAQLITEFLMKLAENTVNNIKSNDNEEGNNNGSSVE